ncbi:MAG: hypothetical protein HON70_04065, partial [Lentisphaerae bacterium]|nr:hypothetical protein [Lentisphaerota bacterium]
MNRWNSLTLLGLLLAMGHIRAAPPLSGNDERFAQGMTVLFPGEQALHFRLRSDPLPDEGQGGAVKDLQLGPPLDLWILDADKNQLSVEDAK